MIHTSKSLQLMIVVGVWMQTRVPATYSQKERYDSRRSENASSIYQRISPGEYLGEQGSLEPYPSV